jgi:hypothetical protein
VLPEQVPEQHSDAPLHAVPAVEHVQVEPAETPEQHWLGAVTAPPVSAQHVLPAPPHVVPGSHCAANVHAMPSDGLQAYCPGLHTSGVLLPEQQAFGVVVSGSGPTHVHTPAVHTPDTHTTSSVQA